MVCLIYLFIFIYFSSLLSKVLEGNWDSNSNKKFKIIKQVRLLIVYNWWYSIICVLHQYIRNLSFILRQTIRDELYGYLERHNNSLQPYFNPDLVSAPACWRVIGKSVRYLLCCRCYYFYFSIFASTLAAGSGYHLMWQNGYPFFPLC